MLLSLPAYWKACRKARSRMNIQEEKVAYGLHRRQYAIVVRDREVSLAKPARIAFYFHGGGWTFGRPERFVPAAIPWLRAGFTVVLPSYRRPPQVGLNRIVADCRTTISHFRPPGEPGEVHVGGISAGAHLAALLATHPDWWQEAGWSAPPAKALCCAGPLNFADLRTPSLFLPRYAHLDALPSLQAATTPPATEWLLLHGTNDLIVNPAHSHHFYQRLRELGHPAHHEILTDGKHLDAGRWMFKGRGEKVVRDFLTGPLANKK